MMPSSSPVSKACPPRSVVENRAVKGGTAIGAPVGLVFQKPYSSPGEVRRPPNIGAKLGAVG